jgi:hypothetical protein
MRIFDFFKRMKPSLPTIAHPVFGRMDATLVNDDGSYFWETPEPIPTPKGPISVFLDGPETGPSEEQVNLWHWIYDNHKDLSKAVEPILRATLTEFGLQTHFDKLAWISTGLSPDGDKAGAWDMAFELQNGPIFTVHFKAGAPTVVDVDD